MFHYNKLPQRCWSEIHKCHKYTPLLLIHHYLLGCILSRPLLFSPMYVSCMVIQEDQENGNERQHCVRNNKVVSQLHRWRLVHQVYFHIILLYQVLYHAGHSDIDRIYDKDRKWKACCGRKYGTVTNKRMGRNYTTNSVYSAYSNHLFTLVYSSVIFICANTKMCCFFHIPFFHDSQMLCAVTFVSLTTEWAANVDTSRPQEGLIRVTHTVVQGHKDGAGWKQQRQAQQAQNQTVQDDWGTL